MNNPRNPRKARTLSLEGEDRMRFAAIDQDGFTAHFSARSWRAAKAICSWCGWSGLGQLTEPRQDG